MIISIDGLSIPETLSGNVELFNKDSRRRTVSGRMIIKMAMTEKWRATLNYEGRAIPPSLRKPLYDKCKEMRGAALPVTFISPYDGLTYTVNMFCVEPLPPKILYIQDGAPLFYSNCGAVFEEV